MIPLPRPMVTGFWWAAGATAFAVVAGAIVTLTMPTDVVRR